MEGDNNKNTKYNFNREYITILFEDVGGMGRMCSVKTVGNS